MTDQRLELIRAITDLDHPELREGLNVDTIALFKQMILKDIYTDPDIIEVLHNTELEKLEAPPEDYCNVNIFSYLKIPDTQSVVKNFLCFDVHDLNEVYGTANYVERDIVFRCVSHEDDVKTEYGINRHDLLGMLIRDRFSWTNYMGMQFQKEYDAGKVAENGYYYREIKFITQAPNAMSQKHFVQQLDRARGVHYYGRP